MNIFLTVVLAFLMFLQGIGFKWYARKCTENNEALMNAFNFLLSAVIVAVYLLFTQNSIHIPSLLYGIPYGVLFVSMVFFYNKAVSTGKISSSNFILALAMLIPIICGALFLNETVLPLQIAGIVLFLVASYFVCFTKEEDDKKVSKKSYLYIVIACISSGGMSIFIKLISNADSSVDQVQMLASAMLTGGILMTVLFAIQTRFKNFGDYVRPKWFWLSLLIVVLSTAVGNIMYVIFIVRVPAVIFFPIASGLPMLLGAAVSPLFKEKLSVKGIIGIVLGVVAIVLLNL